MAKCRFVECLFCKNALNAQVVDEIFDEAAAKKMGIDHVGQVCMMLHCGSRGLGHQVATGKSVSDTTFHVASITQIHWSRWRKL